MKVDAVLSYSCCFERYVQTILLSFGCSCWYRRYLHCWPALEAAALELVHVAVPEFCCERDDHGVREFWIGPATSTAASSLDLLAAAATGDAALRVCCCVVVVVAAAVVVCVDCCSSLVLAAVWKDWHHFYCFFACGD